MKKFLIALLSLVVIDIQSALAQHLPKRLDFATVCIVDISGSMAGERLETTKRELLELVDQLQPSSSHTFVLVPFNGQALPAQTFSSKAPAIAAITLLKAGGGTNIASGLFQGRDAAIKLSHAKNLLVVFYSDGEDANQAAVMAEEAKLSAIFRDRHAKNLTNHVSLKRWGNANAQLRTKLMKNPHVSVTDAGDMKIRPIGIHPAIRVSKVQRDTKNPSNLVVDFRAAVSVQTKPADIGMTVQAVCKNQGASGDVSFDIQSGSKETDHRVIVPLMIADEKRGVVDLAFAIKPPKSGTTVAGSVLLPLIKATNISIPVRVPSGDVKVIVASTLNVKGATRWEDPIDGRAVVETSLKISRVDKAPHDGLSRPLTAIIKGKDGCRLTSGPSRITLNAPGERVVQLVFSVPKQAGSSPPLLDLAFDVICTPKTPLLKVQQPVQTFLVKDIPAPSAVIVPLTIVAQRISRPKWVRLPELSFFRVRAAAKVDGQIPRGTVLVMTAPGHVAKLVVRPGELHSGEQSIEMAIWATLPASPQETELLFDVSAKSPHPHQIRVECKKHLRFKVLGPERVQIVDTGRKTEVSVADNVDSATLAMLPAFSGISDPRVARGLTCLAAWDASGKRSKPLPLYSTSILEVPLRKEHQDFFRSVTFDLRIDLSPGTPSTSVVGSYAMFIVTKRPPFVRFFLYMCCGLAPACIGILIFWVFRRFRSAEYSFDVASSEKQRSIGSNV